jgi:hypothetical protein
VDASALFLLQMKKNLFSIKLPLIILTLGTALNHLPAQEQLPREEALKYAYAVSVNLEQLQGTPIATDVDLKRPTVLKDGEYGGMFLPEAKLTAEGIAKTSDKVAPIGQLWLHKLTPMLDNQGISAERLRMAKVTDQDGIEVRVPQCTLGMRRNATGALELLLYGKGTEPLVTAPVSAAGDKTEQGISLEVERDYSGGELTITLFGKYKAKLSFTEL